MPHWQCTGFFLIWTHSRYWLQNTLELQYSVSSVVDVMCSLMKWHTLIPELHIFRGIKRMQDSSWFLLPVFFTGYICLALPLLQFRNLFSQSQLTCMVCLVLAMTKTLHLAMLITIKLPGLSLGLKASVSAAVYNLIFVPRIYHYEAFISW